MVSLRDPDTVHEADVMGEDASPPGVPRWVKVSGLIVVLVVLLAIAASWIVGLEHGPGLHGG